MLIHVHSGVSGYPSRRLPSSPAVSPSCGLCNGLAVLRLSLATWKVITAETGQGPLGFLFGDKLLLIAYGEVIGGVDLGSLGLDDVYWAGDGTVFVRLPEVEVFVATLDNARTRVYDRRTGLVGLNPELESEARREAERLILEAALAEGLKEEGRANAEDFLRAFLEGLGASRVVFTDTLPLVQPTPSAVSE